MVDLYVAGGAVDDVARAGGGRCCPCSVCVFSVAGRCCRFDGVHRRVAVRVDWGLFFTVWGGSPPREPYRFERLIFRLTNLHLDSVGNLYLSVGERVILATLTFTHRPRSEGPSRVTVAFTQATHPLRGGAARDATRSAATEAEGTAPLLAAEVPQVADVGLRVGVRVCSQANVRARAAATQE